MWWFPSRRVLANAAKNIKQAGYNKLDYNRNLFGSIDKQYVSGQCSFNTRNAAIRRLGMYWWPDMCSEIPWYHPFKRRHAQYEHSFFAIQDIAYHPEWVVEILEAAAYE